VGKAAKRKREARATAPAAPVEAAPKGPRRVPRWLVPGLLGGGLVTFLVLKCFALHPHSSDEGIYFYDALRIAQGARLYRDLFFAHPPLHLLVPALVTKLFGYHFLLLKSLPQLAAAVEGVLVFAIGRRVFGSSGVGLVAAYALWFSNDFLKASSYLTGINQADALLCAALLLLLHRRALVAGLLAGAAVMTLIQTAPVAFGFGVGALLIDRRLGLRYVIGGAGVVVGINAIFALYAGGAFFEQVYLYHLHKAGEGGGMHMLSLLAADDLLLFAGGGLGLLLFSLERDDRRRQFLQAASSVVLLQIVAMTTRPQVFPFYFQPIFPLLALGLGWAVHEGVERARTRKLGRDRALGAALAAGVLLGPQVLEVPLTALISPTRSEQRHTYTQSYIWRDAPLVGPLNGLVRALFFGSGARQADTWYLGITEYLWNQSRSFDSYPAIVDEVRAAAPDESATVFGDSISLPLVALGSGRRIAADFADTNQQRFASGTTPPDAAIALLETAPPRLVLTSGNGGFYRFPEFQRWVTTHYRERRSFADADGTRYTLHERR
jgi:hypothetical protein